ncbi:MAG: hypothetical protein IMZ55_12320 [Acidobacteria bacterium]|nr:hypothetical protein [Acidobacteriota bacterium]
MASLNEQYAERLTHPSDIVTLLPVIHGYAAACRHVTEFGVHEGNSTVAILHARPERFVSYDIREPKDLSLFQACALQEGLDWEFRRGSSLDIQIEPTDLLFIDTWHHGVQIKAELYLHHARVANWILMHDTETNAVNGSKGHPGMRPAIWEFLEAGDWVVHHHLRECNGLTVLRRARPAIERILPPEEFARAKQLMAAQFGA